MQAVLIVIQLIVSVSLIGVVLLQRSEGGALGMGGSGGGLGLFSPRGAGDWLTRATAILGVCFFGCSLALTLLALHSHPQGGLFDSPAPAQHLNLGPHKPLVPAPQDQTPAIPAPH